MMIKKIGRNFSLFGRSLTFEGKETKNTIRERILFSFLGYPFIRIEYLFSIVDFIESV